MWLEKKKNNNNNNVKDPYRKEMLQTEEKEDKSIKLDTKVPQTQRCTPKGLLLRTFKHMHLPQQNISKLEVSQELTPSWSILIENVGNR